MPTLKEIVESHTLPVVVSGVKESEGSMRHATLREMATYSPQIHEPPFTIQKDCGDHCLIEFHERRHQWQRTAKAPYQPQHTDYTPNAKPMNLPVPDIYEVEESTPAS